MSLISIQISHSLLYKIFLGQAGEGKNWGVNAMDTNLTAQIEIVCHVEVIQNVAHSWKMIFERWNL